MYCMKVLMHCQVIGTFGLFVKKKLISVAYWSDLSIDYHIVYWLHFYVKIYYLSDLFSWYITLFLQSLISTQSRLVISPSTSDPSDDSVLASDAICIQASTDDVRVGDSLLVLPGETIPVDVCNKISQLNLSILYW